MDWISHGSLRRFFVAATLALVVPMVVVAGPRMLRDGECGGAERPGGPAGEMLPPYLAPLNLDEAQRDKAFSIIHEQVPAMREGLKRLGLAEGDLRRLTAGPDYDEVKAKGLAERIGRASSEVALLRAATDRRIFEVLTPEQRKRLAESRPEGGPCPMPPGPGAR